MSAVVRWAVVPAISVGSAVARTTSDVSATTIAEAEGLATEAAWAAESRPLAQP